MEQAAQRVGVTLDTVLVSSADELVDAFRQLNAQNAQAVLVQQDPLVEPCLPSPAIRAVLPEEGRHRFRG